MMPLENRSGLSSHRSHYGGVYDDNDADDLSWETSRWLSVLRWASRQLQADSTPMYSNLAIKRLLLITDVYNDTGFLEAINLWIRAGP